MQLGLFAVVVCLSWVDITGGDGHSKTLKGKRQRRISTEASQGCAKGCDLCSEFNGCLRCSPKLFILLERNDIRQIGICLPSCPLGYFDMRNPDMNKCIKCKIENCEDCFSRNFCTKCKEGLYLHKGKCYATCPEGYAAANGTMECSSPECKIENCEDCFSRNFCTKCKEGLYLHKGKCYATCPEGYAAANGTMECSSPAQCEMSEWGPWGTCSKKRKLCGFTRGNEERSRKILQAPSGDVSMCPPTTERRRCTVKRTPCREGRKKAKEEEGRRDHANPDRNRKDGKDGRSGSKRRKGSPRGTVVPVTSPP